MASLSWVRGRGVIDPGFPPASVEVRREANGVFKLRSPAILQEWPAHACEPLRRWAEEHPDRLFLADRGPDGAWRKLSYGEAWRRVRAIGAWLATWDFDESEPLAILSEASIEHALMMLGAMSIGMPVAPISPSYSLIPGAIGRLEAIGRALKPGVVFVQTAGPFARARALPEFAEALWVTAGEEQGLMSLSNLEACTAEARFQAAWSGVRPQTVAKYLFTSGSTGQPKGVINTHQMISANATAVCQALPPPADAVQVDWLPWHHTMGGNTNLFSALFSGGAFYIDDGRPTPDRFARTLRNLAEVSPTSMMNVPIGYEMLAGALERDAQLRDRFFARLQYLMYAGAGLPAELWARFQALAVEATGRNIAFLGGYGATETGPGISSQFWFSEGTGQIGLPIPGVEMKLVPAGEHYAVRVRGPAVMPGYLGRPDLTATVFDEEGFYDLGDAVQFVDPEVPERGLRFTGRIAENFKLANGAWVAAGELRQALLEALHPLVGELLIAGHDRPDVRILVWPGPLAGVADRAELTTRIREGLAAYNARQQAATHRVAGFAILDAPPSMEAGEVTDKGSVNQRVALARRVAEVEALYAPVASAEGALA